MQSGPSAAPPVRLWGDGPGPIALLIGSGLGLVKKYVTARRKDGEERSDPPNLQEHLLIQQVFSPVCQILSFFTFSFPRSQWPTGARSSTTPGFNEGFGRHRPKLAGMSNFRQ